MPSYAGIQTHACSCSCSFRPKDRAENKVAEATCFGKLRRGAYSCCTLSTCGPGACCSMMSGMHAAQAWPGQRLGRRALLRPGVLQAAQRRDLSHPTKSPTVRPLSAKTSDSPTLNLSLITGHFRTTVTRLVTHEGAYQPSHHGWLGDHKPLPGPEGEALWKLTYLVMMNRRQVA